MGAQVSGSFRALELHPQPALPKHCGTVGKQPAFKALRLWEKCMSPRPARKNGWGEGGHKVSGDAFKVALENQILASLRWNSLH